MGSLSSSPRINDCPCYVKHPTTERAPRAHPHETSDGSGRRGGGRGERYLSRAVARARILNNSWSAEEVEDLATPGHFGFSINIPPPPSPPACKKCRTTRATSDLRNLTSSFELNLLVPTDTERSSLQLYSALVISTD